MNNKVIITADDYGVCDRIDAAVDQAAIKGHLTSVSFVVTHEGWEKRLDRLKEVKQEAAANGHEIGIGLHFCITSGKPAADNPTSSLLHLENREFFREVKNYNFGQIEQIDMRDELEAQFRLLKNALADIEIDHLTNHHGLVYFDGVMFEEYVKAARRHAVPIRSPMSWYRKFKKFQDLPDFDKEPITNPTMRRGIKIGMWRKLGQMSYGNFLKRMNDAERELVNYPDVLCEYFYGQCHPKENHGSLVLDQVLHQFISQQKKEELNKDRKRRDRIQVDRNGIKLANEFTIKKSQKAKNPLLDDVADRYKQKNRTEEFTMELMFHLGMPDLPDGGFDSAKPPHGINTDYFNFRDGEYQALMDYNLLPKLAELHIEKVPFKMM